MWKERCAAGNALAVCGMLGACTSLIDTEGLSGGRLGSSGGTGATAGESSGGNPAMAGTDDAGVGGSAGFGGNGGAGGDPVVVECPEDDGTAAALTLTGLGQTPGGSGDAGASDAGDAGAGELEFEGLALPDLVGWATQPGLGTATTIGGAEGEIVTARTAEELLDYANRPEPLVIRICSTLSAPTVRVNSHKTLLGVGPDAAIEGGLLIAGDIDYARNIVVKNLRINAATSTALGEAVRLYKAHHVWLDHCEFLNATGDGMVDIVSGSDFVTISWTKFHFTPDTPDGEHRFGCRIGDHNQGDELTRATDEGHLNVTLHHNWWGTDVRQRAPRVRFGNVHLFNNYWYADRLVNDYSIWSTMEARVLLESNYFRAVANPHEVRDANAHLARVDNIYDGVTGLQQTTDSAFVPPYSYALDPASGVPDQVTAGAGPR